MDATQHDPEAESLAYCESVSIARAEEVVATSSEIAAWERRRRNGALYHAAVLGALFIPWIPPSFKFGLLVGSSFTLTAWVRSFRSRWAPANPDRDPVLEARSVIERLSGIHDSGEKRLRLREHLEELQLTGMERWNLPAGILGVALWSVAAIWSALTDVRGVLPSLLGVLLFLGIIGGHLRTDRPRRDVVRVLEEALAESELGDVSEQ